jgi:hypothetical protein
MAKFFVLFNILNFCRITDYEPKKINIRNWVRHIFIFVIFFATKPLKHRPVSNNYDASHLFRTKNLNNPGELVIFAG